ncbi:MAG: hypothetical protein V1704_01775 [Candidatus Vogelbacteria bacterium]
MVELGERKFFNHMISKKFLIIQLFILVIGIGVSVFFISTRQSPPAQQTAPSPTSTLSITTPTPTNTQLPSKQAPTSSPVDETNNWQTYHDDKYGFEFQYPKDVLVSKDISTGLIHLTSASDKYLSSGIYLKSSTVCDFVRDAFIADGVNGTVYEIICDGHGNLISNDVSKKIVPTKLGPNDVYRIDEAIAAGNTVDSYIISVPFGTIRVAGWGCQGAFTQADMQSPDFSKYNGCAEAKPGSQSHADLQSLLERIVSTFKFTR